MALGLADVEVGTWTSPDRVSGCTVVLPPPGALGAVAVRGQSPGIRLAASLGPTGKLTVCHGVVLAGSSLYGMAAADGVTSWLERQGIGYPVGDALVPIVGAAILLDRGVAAPTQRPDAIAGIEACEAATSRDPQEGSVGAGTGCTIAKVGGLEHAWRGGQGIAVRRVGDLVVGAIVANNAVGELRADDGTWLARARIDDDQPRYPLVDPPWLEVPPAREQAGGAGANTVIGCIVTNARLDKVAAWRVADLAHAGIDRAVRPANTYFDGDALFCLATGHVDAHHDRVVHLATEAIADAARRGPLAAVAGGDLPALRDVRGDAGQ